MQLGRIVGRLVLLRKVDIEQCNKIFVNEIAVTPLVRFLNYIWECNATNFLLSLGNLSNAPYNSSD